MIWCQGRLLPLGAFALLLAFSPATAQNIYTQGAPNPNVPLNKDLIDTNKDGQISPEESRAYLMRLQSTPAPSDMFNKPVPLGTPAPAAMPEAAAPASPPDDAALTPTKPAPQPAAPAQPVPVPMKRTVENVNPNEQKIIDMRLQEMKGLDANNDGILQAAEMMQASSEKFTGADSDQDGILTPAEIEAALEKFRINQEQSLGPARGKQESLRLKNRMKNADQNNDGTLSQAEYEGFFNERYAVFDRDGDGVITEEEYRADGEKIPSNYRKNPRAE